MKKTEIPDIDSTYVLVKRVWGWGSLGLEKYVIGSKRSWLNLDEHKRRDYEYLAENTDKEVLEEFKRLALEGERDGKV
jgi:hypothetical protein